MTQVGGVHPLAVHYQWAAFFPPMRGEPRPSNRIEGRHEHLNRRFPEPVELIGRMMDALQRLGYPMEW
jgi:hypothetical protein